MADLAMPSLLIIVLGVFVWSLLEYSLHRWLFHMDPPDNSPRFITFHFMMHGLHHKVPFDKDRLVFPPTAGVVMMSILFACFLPFLPLDITLILASGGILGYIGYDLTHYYLHHGSPKKGSYFEELRRYHSQHHFVHHKLGYGISSKFWDLKFGTAIKLVKRD